MYILVNKAVYILISYDNSRPPAVRGRLYGLYTERAYIDPTRCSYVSFVAHRKDPSSCQISQSKAMYEGRISNFTTKATRGDNAGNS